MPNSVTDEQVHHGRGEVKRSAIQYDQPQLPHIELSVRISDGTLESSVKVPINASPAEKNTAVMKWLEIIQFGLKLPGAAYIEADLSREGSPNV